MTRPITAADISDAAAHKPLAKFGAALIRRPVREGRAMAERDDLISANDDPAGPARRA